MLRNENILTPHYKEIYFGIAKTIEEAKKNSPLLINYWHKYTYCALDIDKYNNAPEEEKDKMVFQSFCDGLRLIKNVDHLDAEKVEKIIKHVKHEGVNTLLIYKTEENNHYKAEVIYKVHSNPIKPLPFYLLLTDKSSGRANKTFINNFDTWWAPYSFGKIILTKNEITIKGKGGLRGEISRAQDGLPEEYKFIIADVLATED